MQFKFLKQRLLLQLLSIICFIFSYIFYFTSEYNISVILIGSAFLLLYLSFKKANHKNWLINPLRIVLPLFLIIQILFWIRCLLVINHIQLFNYSWVYMYQIQISNVPNACSEFLILHYLYFLFLDIFFNSHFIHAKLLPDIISYKKILYIAIPLIILIPLNFLFTYQSKLPLNIIFNYISSNISKLVYLFWGLLTVVFFTTKKRLYKYLVIIGFSINLFISFLIVINTKMRFMMIEQIIAISFVIISIYGFFSKKALNKIIPIIIIFLILYSVSSYIKSQNQFSTNKSFGNIVFQTLDMLVIRGAGYSADALSIQSPTIQALFIEKKDLIIGEILSGLPFSRLLLSPKYYDNISFDMQLYWAYSGKDEICSWFVSSFTSIFYSYNLFFAFIIAAIFGFLHGILFSTLKNPIFTYSWIISQMIYLPIVINGVRKGDLSGIIFNFFLYIIMMNLIKLNKE